MGMETGGAWTQTHAATPCFTPLADCPTNMSLSEFQQRLAAVEAQMGIDVTSTDKNSGSSTDGNNNNNDLLRRLDLLEHQIATKLRPHQLQEIFSEAETLLEELNPGPALTYQTDVSAPMLYRRQLVLAEAKDTLEDLDQLAGIYSLLSIGQNVDTKTKKLSEDQVMNAPILSACATPEIHGRLEKCVEQCVGLQKQVESVASDLDVILDQYQRLVSATSVKMLTLDEELRQLERA